MQAGYHKTDQIRRAINNEDYRRAIKLASKLEKNDLARAMSAYALERLGNRDEALDICESLLPSATDSVALWVTHVYLLARRHKEVAKLYQKGFEAAKPSSREYFDLGVQYFEALARTLDFAEAQTQALRLAKANTSGIVQPAKLWLWAANLAFCRAPRDKQEDPSLQLAEAFLSKAVAAANDPKLVEAVPLRRLLLFQRGKLDETTLSFGPNDSTAERAWMRALVFRGNDEREFSVLLDYVKSGSEPADDIRAVSRLVRLASKRSEWVESARQALTHAADRAGTDKASRGPLLGLVRLELMLEIGGKVNGGHALLGAILRFLRSHGDLPSACVDLRNDLVAFSPPPFGASSSPDSNPQTEIPGDGLPKAFFLCPVNVDLVEYAEMDRWSRRWAAEDFAFRVSPEARANLIELLKADGRVAAHQALRVIGGLEYTDEQIAFYIARARAEEAHSDDWTLLAAYALMDRATLSPSSASSALGAIVLLRARLSASPDNFLLKLALHEAAGHSAGAGRLALDAWKQLRVKQIQYESLGWAGQSTLSSLGLFTEAREFAMGVCDFNSRGLGDAAECFAESMRSVETSSNPVEVVRLELRLRNSFQFQHSISERCLMSLMPSQPLPSGVKAGSKPGADEEEGTPQKSANMSLFARLKVEVEDPARGESHVCLSEHRLVVLLRRMAAPNGLGELCLNHDLDATCFFERPSGSCVQIELERLLSRGGPTANIPRTCGTSRTFLQAWRKRAELWMRLRALLLSSLIAPAESKLSDARALAAGLGLLDSPSSSLVECGLQALAIFLKAEVDVELSAALQLAEKAWSDVGVMDFNKDPRLFLESTSTTLTHGGLLVFAVLARLNFAYKKATKAKPFPYNVANFQAVRDAAVKTFKAIASSLSRVADGVAASVTEMDEALLCGTLTLDRSEVQASRKLVVDSHVESLRRLASVTTVFSTLDLEKCV